MERREILRKVEDGWKGRTVKRFCCEDDEGDGLESWGLGGWLEV